MDVDMDAGVDAGVYVDVCVHADTGMYGDVVVGMHVDVYGGVNAYVMCMCVYTRL